MIAKMVALDWRSMKYYQIRVLLMPFFLIFCGFYSPLSVIPVSVIILLSFSVNPFAVEEKGELNNLYLTLPVSRKTIVTGRYLLSLIMMLCGIVLGILMTPIANMISRSKWLIGIEAYLVIISMSYLIYSILSVP